MAYYRKTNRAAKPARKEPVNTGSPVLNRSAAESPRDKRPAEGRIKPSRTADKAGTGKGSGFSSSGKADVATRFRTWLSGESAKIAPLPLKKKLQYIADYYWLWILGMVTVVSLSGYIVYRAFFTVKDYWFYAIFANTMEDAGNHSRIWEDFVDYAGYDTSQKNVVFNAASYFDPTVVSGTANSYFQAFVAVAEAGDLDIVTMGRKSLEAVGSSGRLLDLRLDSCREICSRYADRLIYCEPVDESYSDEPVPIGIDISDSRLVTRYHVYSSDCALGISSHTQRLDEAERFLDFLFEAPE